jgi:nucleoside-diphosphate-sugar epimerase
VWRGFAEGLEGVIINPSTILGYGNWDQSSSAIFKNIYKGFPWYTKGINGFVGVEDVANATVKLALSDSTQKRFIINAQNCSFQQLFNTIADHFKKDRPSREATIIMSEIAWRLEKIRSIFSGKVPLLTRETSKVAHSNTSFDNGSLLSEFPHFQFTPLEKVIKDSCQKYLDALHNGIISL